jgi:hypothetical protein
VSDARDVGRLVEEGTALERAAAAAFREHKLLGLTMPVWQDARVEWLTAEQIEAARTETRQRRESSVSGEE